ncbi:MAG TPA: hypothetical protein VIM10_07910 [Actinopolymorphaceae bacterium]|jgi:hypothetical protein
MADDGASTGWTVLSRAIAASLADRARAAGVPVVAARPWDDAVDRVHATLFPAATGLH